eukprot:GHRR01000343.1.p1 GENE.GHRR01000343.1~~GHRR01000343.1.p1  ORF type:complete len:522 (+),score=199.12 GHRR01000343.1:793-2358(+)
MKVIKQLNLQLQPPVGIMPLGTGNDLSRSFNWGAEFDQDWIKGHASVYNTLKRFADAQARDLDCWRLRLLLPNSSYKPGSTYAVSQIPVDPEAVAAQAALVCSSNGSRPGCAGEAQQVLMEGTFYNYFSVGADAQAAYNFHHLRDTHPMLASNRVANQFWYGAFSCTSGWFCGTLPSIGRFSCIEVLSPGSNSWTPLAIPSGIKALVLLNLQSYGGGRNIWGSSKGKKGWNKPSSSDGLLEVVGFTHGYHALAVMGSRAKLAHGVRLAQVAGIRLSLRDSHPRPDGEGGEVFMQLDGEPWQQKVPAGREGEQVMLEVVHWGTSKVLANVSVTPEPVKKMTKYLSKQQTVKYLATDSVDVQPEDVLDHQQQQHWLPVNNDLARDQDDADKHFAAGVGDAAAHPDQLEDSAKANHKLLGLDAMPKLRTPSVGAAGSPTSADKDGPLHGECDVARRPLVLPPLGAEGEKTAGSPVSSNASTQHSLESPSAVAVVEAAAASHLAPFKPLHAGMGPAGVEVGVNAI